MSVNILRYYSTDNLFVKISFLFCIKFLFYFVEDFVFIRFHFLFICLCVLLNRRIRSFRSHYGFFCLRVWVKHKQVGH